MPSTSLIEETPVFISTVTPIEYVGGYPVVWHIMRHYSSYGFRRFIICLDKITSPLKDYFLNLKSLHHDFTLDLKKDTLEIHSSTEELDWIITLTHVGSNTQHAFEKYIGNSQHAAYVLGNSLCNVNFRDFFSMHLEEGKLGTVLAVHPVVPFNTLNLKENDVLRVNLNPILEESWVNGGYYFFRRDDRLMNLVEKREPIKQLIHLKQLGVYRHHGFSAFTDTQKDSLNRMWDDGSAPWTPQFQFFQVQPEHESITL